MAGILLSTAGTPTINATNYMHPIGGSAQSWVAQEARVQQVIPVAGVLDYLRVAVIDPGGSGQSRAFKLRKNTADTSLTCTVNTGSTLAQDIVNTVSVAAGDLIAMQCVSSATPATSAPTSWAMRFTAANANEFPLLYGSQTGPAAGTTRYSVVQGDLGVQTTEALAQSVIPTPGVISRLYVALDANMATAGMTVTLYKNGSPTSLTCTVGSGASTANDTSNSVSVVAGDTVSLEWVNAGSNGPRTRAGLKFAPTTDGESIALIPAFGTVGQNLTRFNSLPGNVAFAAAARDTITLACTLKSLYVKAANVASGQTATFTVRRASADTGITCAVTGTGSTANDITHTQAVSDDDYIGLKIVTSATSGTVTPQAGLVLFVTPAAGGNRRRRLLMGAS